MVQSSAGRIGRPPGSRGEDTRPRLLRAAQDHFGRHGYAGARIVEIARDAGMTHSAVYSYFGSKTELYSAALQAALDVLLPEYLAGISGAPTLKEQIAALFRASAHAHAADPTITPFLASVPLEIRRNPELLADGSIDAAPLLAALSAMFGDARVRREIPPDVDDLDLLTAFVGAAMGVGLLAHGLDRGRMDAAVDALLRAFDGSFFRS